MAVSFDDILGGTDACMSLLRALADNSFDSILITDTSSRGRIVYTNKAFKKLTGYDASDVIGKTPRLLQGPGTDKKVIARLSDALASGRRFEGKAADPDLLEALKAEAPGILAWAVKGCAAWQEHGLPLPECVRLAGEDYKQESDLLAPFLGDRCTIDPGATVRASELYRTYSRY